MSSGESESESEPVGTGEAEAGDINANSVNRITIDAVITAIE